MLVSAECAEAARVPAAEDEPAADEAAEDEEAEDDHEDEDGAAAEEEEVHAFARPSNPLREATAFGDVKTPCAVRGRDDP